MGCSRPHSGHCPWHRGRIQHAPGAQPWPWGASEQPSLEPCGVVPVFMLSCSFPRRPDFGEVTVMDLHSGGIAHFHCHLGYELQGPRVLTCINASRPHWSSPEPICSGASPPLRSRSPPIDKLTAPCPCPHLSRALRWQRPAAAPCTTPPSAASSRPATRATSRAACTACGPSGPPRARSCTCTSRSCC